MSDIQSRISAVLSGEPASKDVAETLAEARKAVADIEAQRETTRKAALDPKASGQAVKKARADLSDLEFESDRLTVAIEHLETALAEAKQREEQAKRSGAYDEAASRVEGAVTKLRDRYPSLAGEIRDILMEVCEAAAMANKVNASLPDGRDQILMPPEIAGYIPGRKEEIVSEKIVKRWVSETSGAAIQEQHLQKDTGTDGRRRILDGAINPHYAVQRQFKEVSYIPAQSVQRHEPIFAGVALPAFDQAPAFWAKDRRFIDSPSPDQCLAAARTREAEREASPVKGKGKTAEAPRPVMTRYVPIDEEQRPALRAVS